MGVNRPIPQAPKPDMPTIEQLKATHVEMAMKLDGFRAGLDAQLGGLRAATIAHYVAGSSRPDARRMILNPSFAKVEERYTKLIAESAAGLVQSAILEAKAAALLREAQIRAGHDVPVVSDESG